jgi:tetratricopeptide (TPR) repeat protein
LVFLIIAAQEASAGIDSSRAQIISLADEGKLTQVDEAIDKLIAEHTKTDQLHSNLLIIADSFAWRRLYERSDRLYDYILENTTDGSLITRARLGLNRVEILDLIGQKEYSAAQQKVDLMVSDFKNEPVLQTNGGQDLATALFQIGKELTWQQRYVEAKNAFDRLIEIQPQSPPAGEAKLWSARTNVCELIIDGKYEQALSAIDKLISDFEGEAGLPEAIYWISKQYEWTKGTVDDRSGWYDEPNSVYQRLIRQFSNSSFGQDAEWDQKRLVHRIKIFKLIKETDQNEIDAAIEEMVNEFSGRPELVEELHWIACGYEEQQKDQKAKQMFERIIKEHPDTEKAKNAVLDIRRSDILEKLKTGDVHTTEVLMDKFVADFNQHPYAGPCLNAIAIKYYNKGMEIKQSEEGRADNSPLIEKQPNEADICFRIAAGVWEKIITQLRPCSKTAEACYFAAVCYREHLGEYEKAIIYYQKVLDGWPNYEHAWHAQYSIGNCYEKLLENGQISRSEAMPEIINAYKAVVEKYPNCRKAKGAMLKLKALGYQEK